MKIVFLSNFFNHHQSALADALWEKTRGEYLFVETTPMPEERKKLGYRAVERAYVFPFQENEAWIIQKIREADVVIAGSAPEWLIRKRIQTGKLLFRYAERPLRNGLEPAKYIPRLLRWHWRNPWGKPIYLLCASAYTAGDYAKYGLFRGRTFRWGYFPERKQYDLQELLSSKDPAEILWCGRFLELKHPEDVLVAARKLKDEGYAFRVNWVGTGELEGKLRQMVKDLGLEGHTHFLGAQNPEDVRLSMEQAGIYLFTSDKREGWGAVLNEAMNSGCAVIASHAIGSVPYLIRDGENGIVYPSGNVGMLYEKMKYLLEHPQEQKRLGAAAYQTIQDIWNAEIAADRLIKLSQSLLSGEKKPMLVENGPGSRAEVLDEGWFA